ncbi:DUF29 domain-containing protein [Zavarzinia compransoris]|uniref:DUF29 domain-containing protein n=1 Tax=Zavarzinia compransoris TaxID=1264899 RepID=A0A317E266_9PROT|nr:DUF29 domain-containing protein [Zavarzinia compransoris]PWR20671.1 DUF29 domain-containing protein [Zavarzinia compransoris]TDP44507.1 uncharacterized protein DUF29 [Zavarzinia compransoris]
MTGKSRLYEEDFYAWANEQAALLRAGRLAAADIEHIAEEIESMGKAEKRELISRLAVLLLHLLKWRFQPALQGASWRTTILNQRDDLADLLADNPSLRAQVDDSLQRAYRKARRTAGLETGLAEESFPPACPWSFDQIIDPAFWPAGD